MKTQRSPDGSSFFGFGSASYWLNPCKFCGGAATEIVHEQIEVNSWVGRIDCSECDASLTLQYTSPSPDEAVAEVIRVWNNVPEVPA